MFRGQNPSGPSREALISKTRLANRPGLIYRGPMTPNLLDRITIEPGKCGGRPCIRGYRLRVKDVLSLLAAGSTAEEILSDYDFLEPDDIRACFQYASAQAAHEVVRLQPA